MKWTKEEERLLTHCIVDNGYKEGIEAAANILTARSKYSIRSKWYREHAELVYKYGNTPSNSSKESIWKRILRIFHIRKDEN